MSKLQTIFLDRLCANSGFDERRAYVGMSKAGDCPLRIYREFFAGVTPTTDNHVGAWLGYTMEAAILKLLDGEIKPGRELSAFDGLVRGHTDGEWDGCLLEIKSTTWKKLAEIEDVNRIPQRHYCQVQAYMRFGGWTNAHVLYVPRDYGQPIVVPITYREVDGVRMERRFADLVSAVKTQRAPRCECGRCT